MRAKKDVHIVNYKYLAIGILAFFVFISFVDLQPGKFSVTATAAIALLMAFWWITETLPIGVTSLLPIILFPLLGVLDGKTISNAYINYVIFLFIGGFIMALAIEKWDLHKRIAIKILAVVGGSPIKILFGFMFASAFLSMWMSNTATAMMMLPIAFSVSNELEKIYGEKTINKFTIGLLLSIAYACSIGGVSTLVGTPPNLSFLRIFEIIYPTAPEISFGQWLVFALPLSIILFIFTLVLIYFMYKPKTKIKSLEKSFFIDKYEQLGPVTKEQKRTFILFILMAILWVFRKNFTVGDFTIYGWSELFKNPAYINDGTIAILIASILFITPASRKNETIVDWRIMKKIPWNIVFLFGGGFALAKGFIDSGLSEYIGGLLTSFGSLQTPVLVASIAGIMSILTEFTSNAATTEMMLPIISSLAMEIKVNPLLLMIPTTLAASMAFMFPIATPPNAIIFGTGKLKVSQMIKTGIFINIVAILVITILTITLGAFIFDIDPQSFPDWASEMSTKNHH